MTLKCGIVGFPNVGKSTLFNAITQTQIAEAANYPFCTIEPNVGRVAVPDRRLNRLAKIAESQRVIYNQIELADIAGLVKGASKGEGHGNQFLSNIREVDAVIHVVRCFKNEKVEHVNLRINPIEDIELINLELILADLQSVEKRLENSRKLDQDTRILLEQVLQVLHDGKPVRLMEGVDSKQLNSLQLITSKPVLYVCNVEEESALNGNEFSDIVKEMYGDNSIIISAKIEEEIANLSYNESDKLELLDTCGLKESGLSVLVRASYSLLNLITFFTVGAKEARAWSVIKGSLAPQAAGLIHTDFEKGFIKADVISYDDYVKNGGELKCREIGKVSLEGKKYVIKDGDIIHFKFN